MSTKLSLYTASSVAASVCVIYYWSDVHGGAFYPTVLSLSTHRLTSLLMLNTFVSIVIVFARVLHRIFFGTLHDAEVEAAWEKLLYQVTDAAWILLLFRSEVDAAPLRFLWLYCTLLFFKSFHWLVEARVERLTQQIEASTFVLFRIFALLLTLFTMDVIFASIYGKEILKFEQKASILLVFGFEYSMLAWLCLSLAVKLPLSLAGWSQLQYTADTLFQILKLSADIAFFFALYRYFGTMSLLYIGNDFWRSLRYLNTAVQGFIQYQRVIWSINNRFEDATTEELEATDAMCIVCREHMEPGQGAKKLPCGHMFHMDCLKMWLQRQSICPTCRRPLELNRDPVFEQGAREQRQRLVDDAANLAAEGAEMLAGAAGAVEQERVQQALQAALQMGRRDEYLPQPGTAGSRAGASAVPMAPLPMWPPPPSFSTATSLPAQQLAQLQLQMQAQLQMQVQMQSQMQMQMQSQIFLQMQIQALLQNKSNGSGPAGAGKGKAASGSREGGGGGQKLGGQTLDQKDSEDGDQLTSDELLEVQQQLQSIAMQAYNLQLAASATASERGAGAAPSGAAPAGLRQRTPAGGGNDGIGAPNSVHQ
jgi:E3 ubiquitin-protein ligase synoviolin